MLILSQLYLNFPSAIAFPVLDGLKDIMNYDKKTTSLKAMSRRVEYFYKIKKQPFSSIITHPSPSFLVTEETLCKGFQLYHSAPMDWVGHKFDILGWKSYSSSTLGSKISNYEAIIDRY